MIPTHPKVTIVICSYNEEMRISKALQSVLDQTTDDWECLVVDDGSTDHTIDIVRSFHDSRIKLITLPINLGKAHALNAALLQTKGIYLLELDADDWLPTLAVSTLLSEMDHQSHEVGLLTSSYHVWRQTRRGHLLYRGIEHSTPITVSKEYAKVPIPRFYRTDRLRSFGGWDVSDSSCGRLYEDVAMTLQFLQKSRIAIINQPLYHRVIRSWSSSQVSDHPYSAWAQVNLTDPFP